MKNDTKHDTITKMIAELDPRYLQDTVSRPSDAEALESVRVLLRWIGEDPQREGLLKTPQRFLNAYREYFAGYDVNIEELVSSTFSEIKGYEDMVLLRNIPVSSHCEHHIAPIIGKAQVAYIPKNKVLGISKIARIVKAFSRRLQTQEMLTYQIAQSLYKILDSKGSAVYIDAYHHCMTNRGVNYTSVSTVTSKYLGAFATSDELKQRFLKNAAI